MKFFYISLLIPLFLCALTPSYIDKQGHNLLFHGNLPTDYAFSFIYNELITDLHACYRGNFPKEYNLIIISHVTRENPLEEKFLLNIYNYFNGSAINDVSLIPQQTPIISKNKDIFYWWPVRGFKKHTPPFCSDVTWSTLNKAYAYLTIEEITQELVNQAFNDKLLNFPSLIAVIDQLMKTQTDIPQVIYVHSRRGANRNTVSMSAYLMKTRGLSVAEAWEKVTNRKEPTQPIFEPEEAKSFLYYYQVYLNLFGKSAK